MPTPHRRIGLVLDGDLDRLLRAAYPGHAGARSPDATVVRRAVLAGAGLEQAIRVSADDGLLAEALDALREAVDRRLRDGQEDAAAMAALADALAGSLDEARRERRRQRQLAFLHSSEPLDGGLVLGLRDELDG